MPKRDYVPDGIFDVMLGDGRIRDGFISRKILLNY